MLYQICLNGAPNSECWNENDSVSALIDFIHISSGGLVTRSFRETPSMSTYLIAFVVSNFEFTTNNENPNVFRYRVYCQPAKVESTRLALDVGEKTINIFQNYLEVNYTFPKMDQVAVPDFLIGGNETNAYTQSHRSNFVRAMVNDMAISKKIGSRSGK